MEKKNKGCFIVSGIIILLLVVKTCEYLDEQSSRMDPLANTIIGGSIVILIILLFVYGGEK